MRTSLEEIKKIDDYLSGQLSKEETLLLEAQLIINYELKEKLLLQKEAYDVIKMFGRKVLRAELESIHRNLFSLPEHRTFKNKILNFFKKQN